MPEPTSEKDRELLLRAAELQRPLARAAKVARSNGTWLAIFGGLTVLFGVFGPDYVAILLGACLVAVGVRERRLGAQLGHGDSAAARRLAQNEMILLGATLVYCTLKLTLLRPNVDELQDALGNSMPDLDVEGLLDSMSSVVYGTVMIVALLYQGGMARYFLHRQPDVERFNAEVPHWARDMLTKMSGPKF